MPPCFATTDLAPMLLGLICIALAVWAIARQVDVRLALFLAGLALATLAEQPHVVLIKFLTTFTDEKFVVPICTAMGFAYVLRQTGCDQHLVHLLLKPIGKARALLIPGTVLVGFLVNMPIVSQTSTAVTIGSVIIPLLMAARIAPIVIGAALLLGSSIGGELFNPGAPELRTTVTESQNAAEKLGLSKNDFDEERCIQRLLPLNLLGLTVAVAVFWPLAIRVQRRTKADPILDTEAATAPNFQVNYLKATVPLVPLLLLYLSVPPFKVLDIPFEWLVDDARTARTLGLFNNRLIGAAMLLGVAVAAAAAWPKAGGVGKAFFEGAGYGFTHIVSLIVTANCFGEGIRVLGLAKVLGDAVAHQPELLIPAAGCLSLAFAALCGSGMATTQSLFGFFALPALELDIDPTHVGAVVSLASAAGRTMSPVAAVTLMCAQMTKTTPFQLARLVALPLLVSTTAIIIAAMALAPKP